MVATIVQDKGLKVENDTTPAVTLDSVATAGNILISIIAVNGGTLPFTAPSGWTLDDSAASSTNASVAVAYKVSDGTEQVIEWTHSGAGTNDSDIYVMEVSGLTDTTPHVTTVLNSSAGGSKTSWTTGTTDPTTADDTFAVAFMGSQDSRRTETGRAWTESFSEVYYFLPTGIPPGLSVAAKILSATGTVESTFSTTDDGDQMVTGILVWEIATGPIVDSINDDDEVDDGQQNNDFVSSNFAAEIDEVVLVGDNGDETDATDITSSSGTGTFDLRDTSQLTEETAGAPYTTANNSVLARLYSNSRAETADLPIVRNPIAGWGLTEIASASKAEGSYFQGIVEAVIDESFIYAPLTVTFDATGVMTTDETEDIDTQWWDKTTGTYKQRTIQITPTPGTPVLPTRLPMRVGLGLGL